MSIADKPAFPVPEVTDYDYGNDPRPVRYEGLTLRQHFALEMMKASRIASGTDETPEHIAKLAIEDADALIAALEAGQ